MLTPIPVFVLAVRAYLHVPGELPEVRSDASSAAWDKARRSHSHGS